MQTFRSGSSLAHRSDAQDLVCSSSRPRTSVIIPHQLGQLALLFLRQETLFRGGLFDDDHLVHLLRQHVGPLPPPQRVVKTRTEEPLLLPVARHVSTQLDDLVRVRLDRADAAFDGSSGCQREPTPLALGFSRRVRVERRRGGQVDQAEELVGRARGEVRRVGKDGRERQDGADLSRVGDPE